MAKQGHLGKLLGGASVLAVALIAVGTGGVTPALAQEVGWASVADIDNYAWIDRADAMSQAIGDSPPDFAFSYDGREIWAWTLGDGSVLIAEQRADGPHSYYFDARADAPFLIRRADTDARDAAGADMSFGYLRGAIAVVYTSDGGVLRREQAQAYFASAAADWERGRKLRRAMQDRQSWRNISVSLWFDFSPIWYDWGRRWDAGRLRHPEWRRHHDRADWEGWRHRYDDEHRRREAQSDRFNRWRHGDFQGTAPGRYQAPPSDWRGGRDHRPDGHDRPGDRPPHGNGETPSERQPWRRGPNEDGGGARSDPGSAHPSGAPIEIGRASCRERVCNGV